jgi:hypothetical protein
VLAELLVVGLVSTFMLEVGISTSPWLLRAEIVHRSPRLVRGLLFCLVLQPLLAWAVLHALAPLGPPGTALAILSATGVVPLAGRAAKRAKGELGLALVLTLLLGALTPLTAPPTIRWLLHYSGALGFRPERSILQLLGLQLLPLAAGLAVQAVLGPTRARRVAMVVRGVNVAVVGILVVGLFAPRLGRMTVLGWRGAGAAVLYGVIAALVGHACGASRAEQRTLATLANVPNVALGLTLLAGAGAPPVARATLLAMFLLRYAVGLGYLVTAIDFRKRPRLYTKNATPMRLTIRNSSQTARMPPPR